MDDSRKPLRILMLEDNLDDVERFKDELSRAGVNAVCPHVHTESAFIAQLNPPPDLILADFTLSIFDPLGVITLLQERGLDVPLIIVADSISQEVAAACVQYGAVDFLLKDRVGRLGWAVRSVLGERGARLDRQRAVRELHESERRFRALVQNSSDTIAVLGFDGTIEYISPSVRALTGTLARVRVEILGNFVGGDKRIGRPYPRSHPKHRGGDGRGVERSG